MPRALHNPDRNFSATPVNEGENLRDLLKKSEVADMFDPIVRRRFGDLIVRAVFHPAKHDHDNDDSDAQAIGEPRQYSRAGRSRKT
jgi:hypothetical protein